MVGSCYDRLGEGNIRTGSKGGKLLISVVQLLTICEGS